MLYAQLSHALSLNDICDCLRFHAGYLSQIRDCVPPSRNGLAHANASREPKMAEELFWTVLAEIKQTLQLAGFLIASENAIKWQIWTALPAYLLLRLVGWIAEWKQSFHRLYTLVKEMLWNRRNSWCLTLTDNSA